jgi:hypothetical protein
MGYVAFDGEWVPRKVDREGGSGEPVDGDEERLPGEEAFVIGNEFATVRCRKVFTRNGERLEIEAPKIGLKVHLDAIELEALTGQTPADLSELVRRSGHDH